jgi:ribosomal protein S6E (S10)
MPAYWIIKICQGTGQTRKKIIFARSNGKIEDENGKRRKNLVRTITVSIKTKTALQSEKTA